MKIENYDDLLAFAKEYELALKNNTRLTWRAMKFWQFKLMLEFIKTPLEYRELIFSSKNLELRRELETEF